MNKKTTLYPLLLLVFASCGAEQEYQGDVARFKEDDLKQYGCKESDYYGEYFGWKKGIFGVELFHIDWFSDCQPWESYAVVDDTRVELYEIEQESSSFTCYGGLVHKVKVNLPIDNVLKKAVEITRIPNSGNKSAVYSTSVLDYVSEKSCKMIEQYPLKKP